MRMKPIVQSLLRCKLIQRVFLTQPLLLKNITGSLDNCDEAGGVTGWVFNRDSENEYLHVEIFADGNPVGRAIADIFRADLQQAGIGDGRHGFEVMLPDSLLDGNEHSIEVREASTGTVLRGLTDSATIFKGLISECRVAGKSIYMNAALAPGITSGYFGFIDSITEEGIRGWVLDREKSNESHTVSIFFAGELIGTAISKEPRADITAIVGFPVNPGLYFNWQNAKLPARVKERDQEAAQLTFILEANGLKVCVNEQPKVAELYSWVRSAKAIATLERQATLKDDELRTLRNESGQKIQRLEQSLIKQEALAGEYFSELTNLRADGLIKEDELAKCRATIEYLEPLVARNKELETILAKQDKMAEHLRKQMTKKNDFLAICQADLTHLRQELDAYASWKAELQKDLQRIERIIKSA